MTREEFYKLTDILSTDVLGNFMHGGEANELIAMFEEVVEHSNILEQEEPVSEEFNAMCLDENGNPTLAKETDFTRGFVKGAQWQKRKDSASVSEELEQEIDKYVNIPDNQGLPDLRRELSDCARHFAKWQKQQDQSTIELTEDHAMLAGMEKMKEQMMKDAVGGYVIKDIEEGNGDFLLSADYLPVSMGLKDRQKVKVIILKDE